MATDEKVIRFFVLNVQIEMLVQRSLTLAALLCPLTDAASTTTFWILANTEKYIALKITDQIMASLDRSYRKYWSLLN
jgi:hypothetical protein